MKLTVNKISVSSIIKTFNKNTFLLKPNVKDFFFEYIFPNKLWYRQLSLKLFFCDILRRICHIDFKCDSISFHP